MPAETEGLSSIRVAVDAGLKAKWEVNREKIAQAQRGGAECFIGLWKAVTEVIEASPPLYLAASYASASAFIVKYLKVPIRTATRNMEVARVASRAEVVRFGVTRLEAALGLRTKENTSFDKLKVAVERNSKVTKVNLEEATVEEVRRAVRNLHPKRRVANKPPNAIVVALTQALSKARLEGVTVMVARSGITFRGLQLDEIQSLVDILARVKLPTNPPAIRKAA